MIQDVIGFKKYVNREIDFIYSLSIKLKCKRGKK